MKKPSMDEESENKLEPTPCVELAQELEIAGTTDEIDLALIALPQDFSELVELKTETVAVPLHRPGKQTWFAPHPDAKQWITVAIIEDEGDHKANYVLDPAIAATLPQGEWAKKVLVPCMTRQGAMFLWPIRRAPPDKKLDPWNQSALVITTSCGDQWIRVSANQEVHAYEAIKPISPLPPPIWPGDLKAIYQKAFAGIVIRNLDHPLLKQLRGEV